MIPTYKQQSISKMEDHHDRQPKMVPLDLEESESESIGSNSNHSRSSHSNGMGCSRRKVAVVNKPLHLFEAKTPLEASIPPPSRNSILKAKATSPQGKVPASVLIKATTFVALTIFTLSNGSLYYQAVLRGLGAQGQYADFSAKPQTIGFVYTTTSSSTSEPSSSTSPTSSLPTTLSVVRIDAKSRVAVKQHNYNLQKSSSNLKKKTPIVKWNTHEKRMVEPLSDYDLEESSSPLFDQDEVSNCGLEDWQKKSFPTCNSLHEEGSIQAQITMSNEKVLLSSGSIRNVWRLDQQQQQEPVVLKTLRFDKEWDWDTLNSHRQDAIISERLTSSPWTLDIYGACGNSALYQYANAGSLRDATGAVERLEHYKVNNMARRDFATWSSSKKMNLAYQTVSALAEVHGMGTLSGPSVCHDDFDITQFVSVDGGQTYKLSDFNGAKLIRHNRVDNKECHFDPLMEGGKTRSPEEYRKEKVTHKIDIFSLGNIFYTLLTGKYPFLRDRFDATADKVKQGEQPQLDERYRTSSDPNIQALVEAMKECWHMDPEQRPSAQQVKAKLEPFVQMGTITQ